MFFRSNQVAVGLFIDLSCADTPLLTRDILKSFYKEGHKMNSMQGY